MGNLCVWDLDGTIRPGQLLADTIAHGAAEGFIDLSRFEDPTTPSYKEVNYFVEAIAQRSRRDFIKLTDQLTDEAQSQAFPWALERLQDQSRDHHVAVFSHAPDFVVKAFVRGLQAVHHGRGSYFHTSDLVFSGRALTLQKYPAARRYMRDKSLGKLVFAAGDTEADVPLLRAAEQSLVVDPTESLARLAVENNWEVIRTNDA